MQSHPEFSQLLTNGKLRCTLCPRFCDLKKGQRGFCFVRKREGDSIVLTTYGRSSGFCIDPIEKKPLYHFFPGTPVLSFGTAGCNLSCRFCQNWSMSKSSRMDRLQEQASPEDIAHTASGWSCLSVAYTYNDPVIFMEYAVDTAQACHELGLKNVAVTAGYITPTAAEHFFPHMDAANIDLKGFTESFYKRLCSGSLQAVKDTLRYVYHETDTWLEITTLLIPGENDGDQELDQLSSWVASELGPEVPLHFSAFHPDYRMKDTVHTPLITLQRAREIAQGNNLQHVYLGNVHSQAGSATICPGCQTTLVQRQAYELLTWKVENGACPVCSTLLPGRFAQTPGDWGNRYHPVAIQSAV